MLLDRLVFRCQFAGRLQALLISAAAAAAAAVMSQVHTAVLDDLIERLQEAIDKRQLQVRPGSTGSKAGSRTFGCQSASWHAVPQALLRLFIDTRVKPKPAQSCKIPVNLITDCCAVCTAWLRLVPAPRRASSCLALATGATWTWCTAWRASWRRWSG